MGILKTMQGTETAPYQSGRNVQPDLQGHVFRDVRLTFSGEFDASGAVTQHTDGISRALGTVELVQNGEPVIRVEAADLRHIDALVHRRYATMTTPTAGGAATDIPFLYTASIPFDFWMPGAVIDASADRVHVRSKYGSPADVGTNLINTVAGSTGELKLTGKTRKTVSSAGYWRPRWWQTRVDLSSATNERQHREQFDRPMALYGCFVRAFDSSADLASIDGSRVDGLIRKLRVDIQGQGMSEEIVRQTWLEAREDTFRRFGLPLAEVKPGFIFVPFEDDEPKSSAVNHAIRVNRNIAINLRFDTLSTPEDTIAPVTPATGDEAVVTWIGYELIGAAAGTGKPMTKAAQTQALAGAF